MKNLNRYQLIVLLLTLTTGVAQSNDSGTAVRDISQLNVNEHKLREALASRTLSWLTGSSANNDYISVGRVANYFGFVGLRVASGQSLSRRDVAIDTLSILDNGQRDKLESLVRDQTIYLERTNNARLAINRALERTRSGEVIDPDAFLTLGRSYGVAEAELGRVIAQSFGGIAQSLTLEQKSALANIRQVHVSGQGHSLKRSGLRSKLSKEQKKELINSAARFLSWITGSEELNDFEVVGKPSQHFGFVSLRLASNHGVRRGDLAKEVWAMLDEEQRKVLSTAAFQDSESFREFLAARAKLMRTLETAQLGHTIDVADVQRFGAAVGEIEAKMTWSQASAMIRVRDSFTEEQSTKLIQMRAKYTMKGRVEGESLIDLGQRLYAQCVLCHSAENRQAVAPGLVNIVGSKIASSTTFDRYSNALLSFASSRGIWTEALLNTFLASPRALVPGTTMGFDGFDEPDDREALIRFLKSLK